MLAAGLVPIIEPEVDINAEDKAEAERMLQYELVFYLGALSPGQMVCLKLTLPEAGEVHPLIYLFTRRRHIQEPSFTRVIHARSAYLFCIIGASESSPTHHHR